jgi:hypothetical protein
MKKINKIKRLPLAIVLASIIISIAIIIDANDKPQYVPEIWDKKNIEKRRKKAENKIYYNFLELIGDCEGNTVVEIKTINEKYSKGYEHVLFVRDELGIIYKFIGPDLGYEKGDTLIIK